MLSLSFVFLILISLASFVLGIIVLSEGKRTRSNISFALISFTSLLWMIFVFLAQHPIKNEFALLWTRLVFFIAFFQGFALFYFSSVVVREIKFAKSIAKFGLLPYAVLFSIISLFSETIVEDVEFLSWGTNVIPGLFYNVFIVYMPLSVLGMLIVLIYKYRKSRGIEKFQLRYLFLGLILTAIITLTTNLFLPLITGNNKYAEFGPYALIFLIAFTAYAITRYRLMDIRVIIRQGTVYVLSIISVIAITVATVFVISSLTKRTADYWLLLFGLLYGIVIFDPIKKIFQKFANRYLFTSLYDYQKTVQNLSENLTRSIDLNTITSSIFNITRETMKINQVSVYVCAKNNNFLHLIKNQGFRKPHLETLLKNEQLIQYLEKTQEPLVFEEFQLKIEDYVPELIKDYADILIKQIKKLKAAILLPMIQNEKMRGLMILGNKISGDAFSKQDIDLLELLSNQAGIALENARLYKEVQDFTQHLQEKVADQTKNIRKLYDEKNEFLHLISHQLRSPLTALRGYASLLNEKDFEQSPREEKIKVKKRIYDSCENLVTTTNVMLDTLNIEHGRIKFKLEKYNLLSEIEKIINLIRPEYENKNLYLKLVKTKISVPAIDADTEYINQVFQNLIDNAVKYTQKGGLTIKISIQDKEKIKISFQDTGIGISPDEQKNIFREKFYRGKKARKTHPKGTGLGLYLVGQIIKGHQGEIKVKSKGQNRGSEFIITLPIKQKKKRKK